MRPINTDTIADKISKLWPETHPMGGEGYRVKQPSNTAISKTQALLRRALKPRNPGLKDSEIEFRYGYEPGNVIFRFPIHDPEITFSQSPALSSEDDLIEYYDSDEAADEVWESVVEPVVGDTGVLPSHSRYVSWDYDPIDQVFELTLSI